MHLLKFWNTCKEEYESLDEQEREAMIQEFKQSQQATTNILRPCPRARIQEVSDTVRNIELLVGSMSTQLVIMNQSLHRSMA